MYKNTNRITTAPVKDEPIPKSYTSASAYRTDVRQIPFGTGTSIVYNYLDYRFRNDTANTYQLLVYTDGEYLRGELRAKHPQLYAYHIHSENEFFSKENGTIYRNGSVIRETIDKSTGKCIKHETIRNNHAKVMYDTSNLEIHTNRMSTISSTKTYEQPTHLPPLS